MGEFVIDEYKFHLDFGLLGVEGSYIEHFKPSSAKNMVMAIRN